jgi:hypothetical protein
MHGHTILKKSSGGIFNSSNKEATCYRTARTASEKWPGYDDDILLPLMMGHNHLHQQPVNTETADSTQAYTTGYFPKQKARKELRSGHSGFYLKWTQNKWSDVIKESWLSEHLYGRVDGLLNAITSASWGTRLYSIDTCCKFIHPQDL